MIGCSIVGFFQLDLRRNRVGHKSREIALGPLFELLRLFDGNNKLVIDDRSSHVVLNVELSFYLPQISTEHSLSQRELAASILWPQNADSFNRFGQSDSSGAHLLLETSEPPVAERTL